jgi:hypothetical protein
LDEEFFFQLLLHGKVQKRHQHLTKLRYFMFFQKFKLRNEPNRSLFLQQPGIRYKSLMVPKIIRQRSFQILKYGHIFKYSLHKIKSGRAC